MAKVENIFSAVLSNGGTIETIPVTERFTEYVYTGTGVLAGNVTITTSGSPVVGATLIINWNCTFTAGIGGITILGTAIPVGLYGKSFIFKGIYNGSSWDVKLSPNFLESQIIVNANIINSTITGAKIASSTVDISNLTAGAKVQQAIIEVSFEANEQCNNTIKMPCGFVLNSIYYEVIKALSNTDVGTITPKINGSNVTLSSAILIPLSTAINTTASTNCTAANTGVTDDLVSFVAAKTTAGGKVRLTLNWTKA